VRRVVAWVVLVVVVGVVAAGCGGGGGDAAGAVGSLAEVVRIDDRVDVRLGDAVELTAVSSEAQPVELGDLIRTDGSGFAEVTYFDGSLTRLDVDTEFTVVALSDAPEASVVRSEMGVGRTWQRVEELSGEDVFEVETAVATAVVRGTAFVIECPSPVECSFSVFEGSVEVVVGDRSVVVEAGESVTVTAEEVGEPGPLVGDPLVDDGWLARNVGLDDDKGFEELAADGTGSDGEGAGGPGEYEVSITVVDFTWTEDLPPEVNGPSGTVGATFSGRFSLSGVCDGRGPCAVSAEEYPFGPYDAELQVVDGGYRHSGDGPPGEPACRDASSSYELELRPRAGGWDGELRYENEEIPPVCIGETFRYEFTTV